MATRFLNHLRTMEGMNRFRDIFFGDELDDDGNVEEGEDCSARDSSAAAVVASGGGGGWNAGAFPLHSSFTKYACAALVARYLTQARHIPRVSWDSTSFLRLLAAHARWIWTRGGPERMNCGIGR